MFNGCVLKMFQKASGAATIVWPLASSIAAVVRQHNPVDMHTYLGSLLLEHLCGVAVARAYMWGRCGVEHICGVAVALAW